MIVIDNGSDSIKACDSAGTSLESPNAIGRPQAHSSGRGRPISYIGRQLCSLSSHAYNGLVLCRPMEQGFLCDAALQQVIWATDLFSKFPDLATGQTDVVLTVPPLLPAPLQSSYESLCFEGTSARRVRLVTPSYLVALAHPKDVCLVVDVGYAATWVVPYLGRDPIWRSAKRVDAAGMLLTNALKEALSFRQYNLMSDTWLVNHIKHAVCYVETGNFDEVMRDRCRIPTVRYVLPMDGGKAASTPLGTVLAEGEKIPSDAQVLYLGHECFSIPELLFAPSDIGVLQGGMAEAVAAALATFAPEVRWGLQSNIVLVGGCAHLKGLRERLERDVLPLCEEGSHLHITQVEMAHVVKKCAAIGTKAFEPFVSREKYTESRSAAVASLWHGVK